MMRKGIYESKEEDAITLRKTRQEMAYKEMECYRLELAVEFGRCINCSDPLHTVMDVLCDDCATDREHL